MSRSEDLINEVNDLNCSQDRARAILYEAMDNDLQGVINEVNEVFGDLLEDYEYWHINDKF